MFQRLFAALARFALVFLLALPIGMVAAGDDALTLAEGRQAADAGDFKQAFKIFLGLAQTGNAEAQVLVGNFKDRGFGVGVDKQAALEWYEKAALQDHPAAHNSLATKYVVGNGVTQSYEKAHYWFERAAAQGDVYALNNLGNLYWRGLGVEKDLVTAHALFLLAADKGDRKANQWREIIGAMLDADQLAASETLAGRRCAEFKKGADDE